MRKFFLILVFLFWSCSLVEAKVLSVEQKDLYAAYIFAEERPPTTLGYVFTNFGPGNINFLEQIDIVLDEEGRLAGVMIVYTPNDGFRRRVFLKHVSGWMFQEKREGTLSKTVTIRVVTTEELNHWP